MKSRLPHLLCAALLTVTSTSHAADLLEIFHAAQANDPVISAARATLQAGQEKLPQGRAALLPNINLSANNTGNNTTTTYRGPTFLPGGDNNFNSHGYSVNLVQPIYNRQNWLAYSQSELQVAQAEAHYRIAQQDLILRVARAYFDVLIAQDSVRLTQAQQAAISEQLEQAKRNFDLGNATITDTLEAQSRFDLTGAQHIAAQNNLEIKRQALRQITSKIPDELNPPGKQFALAAPQPTDMEQWVNQAQLDNLPLRIAQLNTELANKEVERNRSGHYPTLDLVANHTQTYANGGIFAVGSDGRNTSIGVQLNIPLYQGGAVASKSREAIARQQATQQEVENARRSAAQQARQAYLGVVNGMAQIQALQQALTSSESLLQASKLGQEVGVRTNLDVLNAQQQLYATERDLYQAEYDYLINRLNLKAATGSLDETYLGEINQALH